MKLTKVITLLALAIGLGAQAAVYNNTWNSAFANSGLVPDGNLSGWSDMRTISGILDTRITDVSVQLTISGGYNGDLYAYLSHGNVLIPLLNRVGVSGADAFGSADAGFNVTLNSTGSDVHWATAGGGQLTGTYGVDGRLLNPVTAPAWAFDAAGAMTFGALTGLDPNGSWTLFIADVSGGGGQSQLTSWGLDITAVPEPINVALGVFGAALFVGGFLRTEKAKMIFRRS
jgi:subtilisin-like proprotein convertase family protein